MQNDWIVVGWYPKGSLDLRQLSGRRAGTFG